MIPGDSGETAMFGNLQKQLNEGGLLIADMDAYIAIVSMFGGPFFLHCCQYLDISIHQYRKQHIWD